MTAFKTMLRDYAHIDAASIEAARKIAQWARQHGYDAAPYATEVQQAERRAKDEVAQQERALRLMDTAGEE
jgi:hypothetical protein